MAARLPIVLVNGKMSELPDTDVLSVIVSTSSYALSASYVSDGAFASGSVVSASYALSASYAPFSGTVNGTSTSAVFLTIEDLDAGDLVNIFDNTGSYHIRNADYRSELKNAVGYVTTSFSSGSLATVYFDGIIAGLSSVSGEDQFLSASGKFNSNPPTEDGYYIQFIGTALSISSIEFSPSSTIGLSTISTASYIPIFTSSSFSLSASYAASTLVSVTSSYSISPFIKVDASEFIPRSSSGCEITTSETNTNFINRKFLAFDPSSAEYAQYWFNWPPDWNTAKVTFYWTATANSGSAVLYAGMRTFANVSSQDGVIGEYQGIISIYTGSNICIESTTNPITPSGSIGSLQRTVLQIYRDPLHPADNLSTDLLLEGVVIYKGS
jgi:hypothetical protein